MKHISQHENRSRTFLKHSTSRFELDTHIGLSVSTCLVHIVGVCWCLPRAHMVHLVHRSAQTHHLLIIGAIQYLQSTLNVHILGFREGKSMQEHANSTGFM